MDRGETYTVIHQASARFVHLIRTLANRRPSWDSIPCAPVLRPKHRYRSLPAADFLRAFRVEHAVDQVNDGRLFAAMSPTIGIFRRGFVH
jgi:hypothetical protein